MVNELFCCRLSFRCQTRLTVAWRYQRGWQPGHPFPFAPGRKQGNDCDTGNFERRGGRFGRPARAFSILLL